MTYRIQLLPQQPGEPFTVIMETAPLHTQERPFCDDWRCPCHYDSSPAGCDLRWQEIDQPIEEGLLTWDEADRLYMGGQI